jgi:hypothetical protein
MSRLVINKSNDRTICIIKNFGSIELSENKIKIVDKYGLTAANIFSLEKDRSYSIRVENFDIRGSNAYNTHTDSQFKWWAVSSQAFDEINTLVEEYYNSCLLKAIQTKELLFDNFIIGFQDNMLSIQYKDYLTIDEYTLFKPFNYSTSEIALLGKESYVYIAKDNKTNSIVNVHSGDIFPKYIYKMSISYSYFSVLDKFITDVRHS